MTKIDNNDIFNVIEAGIKAEGLRQKAIAGNIANLDTPGYRRVDVNFKDFLDKALGEGDGVAGGDLNELLYQPENTAVKPNGNDVSMEVEIGQMVKNTLRHKTYIRVLQKKYAQIEQAMNIK